MANTEHEHWMRRCLELAAMGGGRVSPNPMVGSVVVGPGGQVLGEGYHEVYGGPHAERNAIRAAEAQHGEEALRNATLYVNLEPCSHFGKTPPCTDIILEKGIPRVVTGMTDPFPAVSGRGIERLRAHGVEVATGVLEQACRRLNEAFVHHVQTGKPLVTLKIAQTLDGCVATRTGDSRWVSGEASRRLVHAWRATLDGVMIGRGTAEADDPALTVRAVAGRQPIRVVLDRRGVLPPDLRLFSDEFVDRTVVMVSEQVQPSYTQRLREAGGRLVPLPEREGLLDLGAVLEWLGRDGGRDGLPMQSLLVEAGPGLASALLTQDLVDRFYLFIAPKLVGEGVPAFRLPGIDWIADAVTFAESSWEPAGEDVLFKGYRRAL